jgi:hypothetical protein
MKHFNTTSLPNAEGFEAAMFAERAVTGPFD